MTQLLAIRENIKSFYSRYENICYPAVKFLFAVMTFVMINKGIGYVAVLGNPAVILVLALMCSFFPMNFIVIVAVLVILLNLYSLSLECVLIVGVMFLLMFLLYFRFSSKDTILLLLTPLCFMLKIPYVIPVCAGLVATPAAVVSTGCGVVIYYMLAFIAGNRSTLLAMADEAVLEKFRYLLAAPIGNREMQVMVLAFAVTILLVYIIRRLPVDHAWPIAIITGILVDAVVILMGDLKFGTYFPLGGLIIGSIVSLIVALALQFFVFNLDYTRTEKVQFEDDEYYYFVKAIPKNTVLPTERSVKKIKGSEKDDEDDDDEFLHLRRRRMCRNTGYAGPLKGQRQVAGERIPNRRQVIRKSPDRQPGSQSPRPVAHPRQDLPAVE